MRKAPSLPYTKIVRALQRDGWTAVRQRGSHIRLQKRVGEEVLKLTVPAHRPVIPYLEAGPLGCREVPGVTVDRCADVG